jgi:superfamily II DNA or RNA helicase
MVIVDECHHVSAASFERVLREVNAKYVYGLTATPKRQDGHQPIIYMHCGQIRYRDNAKLQAQRRPFEHFVVPRFTSFRVPIEKDDAQMPIQDLYNDVCQNETRNNMIVEDVLQAIADGRVPLVLTERKAHVELLSNAIKEKFPNVITFVGGRSAKNRRLLVDKVERIPAEQQFVIVATGKYVGEGFDVPRLDTLFLAMPFAWQGTLAQYAGRLHRLHGDKREVQVYDYVDVHVAVLDRMYAKRVNGYSSIGYKTKSDVNFPDSGNIIFNGSSFLPVFTNDLLSAKREVTIVSPYLTKTRLIKMMETLNVVVSSGAKLVVMTRPVDDYADKDRLRIAQMLDMLRTSGIAVAERSKIHQKFAVIDGRTSWYGSINLLSFGNSEESIMRLESKGIAEELLRSII